MATDFPLGTIAMFVGPSDHASLATNKWTLCSADVKLLQSSFTDLGNVLAGSFGTDPGYFYLPDLRGCFLRGLDPRTGSDAIDPDGGTRSAIAARDAAGTPGAEGRAVGSLQDDTVGPHTHVIGLMVQNGRFQTGDGHNGVWASQPGQSKTSQAGTGEARPNNLAVYFVMKTEQLAGCSAIPGLVVFYAGDPAIQTGLDKWFWCDGRPLPIDADHKPLHDVIGNAHGRTADGQFCLPDMRGMFLRGVDMDKNPVRDPDAHNRVAPRPDLDGGIQGNTGAAVGSFQAAQLGAHTHDYSLPNNSIDIAHPNFDSQTFYYLTSRAWPTSTCDGSEDRPTNKYVLHLLCWSAAPEIPIGTVIAYGGLASNLPDGWLLCDGQTYPAGGDYQALYNVLGNSHGSIGGRFAVPDFRGYFLRGMNAGRPAATVAGRPGGDPDVSVRRVAREDLRQQGGDPGNAGDAVGSRQGWSLSPHQHTFGFLDESTQNGEGGSADDYPVFIPNLDTTTTGLTTTETRPRNMYVNFLIKAK